MGSIGILITVVGRAGLIPPVAIVSSDYRRTVYDSAPQCSAHHSHALVSSARTSWQWKSERHARRQILDTPRRGS